MIRIGVIGFGYWGPNIVRNFNAIADAQVVAICDRDQKACLRAKSLYSQINVISDHREIIKANNIDAVAIITPVSTHYALARQALEAGKHVFVEKPFTSSLDQAEILIALAEKKRLRIMVDHTFLFTGAVRKIKELIDAEKLGKLYYYDSTRVNLGLFQHDVNVIWDLAVHDLYIMDHLIGQNPAAVVAVGAEHFGRKQENIAYLTLYFKNNFIAHFNVNWISPVKIRMTMLGGDKKMLLWDDMQPDEKIRIYDKGVDVKTKERVYRTLVDYRSGDMWAPKVDHTEALRLQAQYFIDCIVNNKTPVNDGQAGLRVVKILEASDKSLRNSSKMIKV